MKFAFLLLLLIPFSVFSEKDINFIRDLFHVAAQNECKADELILLLEKKAQTPLVKGYIGATTILLARHSINPITKYNYFTEGRTLLESSIQNDPESPDLRYLRFVIQLNVPLFLNYRKNLNEDKLFLEKYLEKNSDADESFRKKIKNALNQKGQNSLVKH
jgi:hypothetical protein